MKVKLYSEQAERFFGVGQKNTFLSELHHLAENAKDGMFVLYTGSAPGTLIWLIHLQFPNLKFILIDEDPFNIHISGKLDSHRDHPAKVCILDNLDIDMIRYSTYEIFILQAKFTTEMARLIGSQSWPMIFWSFLDSNFEYCQLLQPISAMVRTDGQSFYAIDNYSLDGRAWINGESIKNNNLMTVLKKHQQATEHKIWTTYKVKVNPTCNVESCKKVLAQFI